MASKRLLKKDVNYVMGDIIDAAYIHQMAHPKEDPAKSEAIVDEAISDYDELIREINRRDVENKQKHFKAVQADLEKKAKALIEKLNAL
ncbi:hypothetical protein GCM10023115_45320 [Pontixanthobacter gangjinensis]|uniref:Uncharacterized protein n=1 Tax=Christiangramia aestuarii TaxID=1028746 RepID=A0A7M3SXP3_9FLAO|nr:hypothetical protein [Christiangramia aestuarii]MUP41374.1 hypothetical protein [Christiangramia aestuarii]